MLVACLVHHDYSRVIDRVVNDSRDIQFRLGPGAPHGHFYRRKDEFRNNPPAHFKDVNGDCSPSLFSGRRRAESRPSSRPDDWPLLPESHILRRRIIQAAKRRLVTFLARPACISCVGAGGPLSGLGSAILFGG